MTAHQVLNGRSVTDGATPNRKPGPTQAGSRTERTVRRGQFGPEKRGQIRPFTPA